MDIFEKRINRFMEQSSNTILHFPIMILASFFLFFLVIRIVLGWDEFLRKIKPIFILSIFVVVIGMLFGKYGANWGLPWWIYYPLPMLMNVLLPPIVLKMNAKKIGLYLILSFLSAPFIHLFFSFFLGWMEYMPFWKVPHFRSLLIYLQIFD